MTRPSSCSRLALVLGAVAVGMLSACTSSQTAEPKQQAPVLEPSEPSPRASELDVDETRAELDALARACEGAELATRFATLERTQLDVLAEVPVADSVGLLAIWERDRRFDEDGSLAPESSAALTSAVEARGPGPAARARRGDRARARPRRDHDLLRQLQPGLRRLSLPAACGRRRRRAVGRRGLRARPQDPRRARLPQRRDRRARALGRVFTAESHGVALDVFEIDSGDRSLAWSSDFWFWRGERDP